MPEVFLYLFAIYGALCLIYRNLPKKIIPAGVRKAALFPKNEILLVVKVKDAEENIEALVHQCVKAGWEIREPHRLVFCDVGSTDQTRLILDRLAYRYPYLEIQEQEQEGARKVLVECAPGESPYNAARRLKSTYRQEFSV